MSSLLRLHPSLPSSSMAASNVKSFAAFQRRSTPQWSMPFQSLTATSLKLFRYGGGSDLVPLSSSATTSGGSDDSIRLRIDDILKGFDGFPEPVKNFPWMRVLRIFQSIIFELVFAVLRYLSVPLLAITSLSEMSYCAHERKMGAIPIPFAFGFTLAKVLKGAAEDFSSDLKEGETPWHLFLIASLFTLLKLPGMEGVDKEKVQRIIYEMSKGSKYFENEKRKEASVKQKIESLRAQCAKLTEKDISHFQMIANRRILELDGSRDLSKIWLHTDMDAFYAAVETLENPLLKGKPLAVGSLSMICTASYEARKYGIRAAMPGFIARKLCPELILVPTNLGKYSYYSEKTRNVFSKYDPDYIATSLDEAYLDITEICKQRSISSEEVAAELRNTIYQETGLTCSVGVAPNRMLAKACSDINKPNGQFILPNDRDAVMTFISSLPIRKVGGIGKVTEQILREVLGISTCTEILHKGALLYALFSHCSTDFFLCVGLGIGGTDAPQQRMRKSISNERTFRATDDESLLFQNLVDLAETLSNDMQKEGLLGRNLTLKLKTASFEVRTRAISLQKYVNSKEDILIYASKLLKAELPVRLRLLGLRMSHFHGNNHNPLSPKQKTLTGFLHISDTTPSIVNSVHFNSSDIQIMGHETSSSTNESHDFQCELNDLLESNQLFVSNEGIVTSSENQAEYSNKEYQSKCKGKEGMTNIVNFSDRKRAASSRGSSQPFWIDDYICSVCGIEIPTKFMEERQEHLDYHLAQKLQKEDCRSLVFSSPIKKSTTKRQKSSSAKQAKYIPIDAFFVKKST